MSWWTNNDGVNSLKGEPQYIHDDGTHLRNYVDAELYKSIYGGEYTAWTDDLGNQPDPSNQMRLDDVNILRHICTIRQAREDFLSSLGSLNYKERYRMTTLLSKNPFAQIMIMPETQKTDNLTKRSSREGIRVSGRYGGTRIGG